MSRVVVPKREGEREFLFLVLLAVLCIVLVAGLWLAVVETLPNTSKHKTCGSNGALPMCKISKNITSLCIYECMFIYMYVWGVCV